MGAMSEKARLKMCEGQQRRRAAEKAWAEVEGQTVSGEVLTANVAACFSEHAELTKEIERFRDLMWRVVRNCRSPDYRKGQKHPRWVAVMDTVATGSTRARELCREFGVNPDDMVSR